MAQATKPAKATTAPLSPAQPTGHRCPVGPAATAGFRRTSGRHGRNDCGPRPVPSADAAAAKCRKEIFCFSPSRPRSGRFSRPGKLPKTEAFLKRCPGGCRYRVTDTGKNYWKRPRPYTVDTNLANGADDLEKSFSYPSGHSTRGTVFALVLAELFPDKKRCDPRGWPRYRLASRGNGAALSHRHLCGPRAGARDCPDE